MYVFPDHFMAAELQPASYLIHIDRYDIPQEYFGRPTLFPSIRMKFSVLFLKSTGLADLHSRLRILFTECCLAVILSRNAIVNAAHKYWFGPVALA